MTEALARLPMTPEQWASAQRALLELLAPHPELPPEAVVRLLRTDLERIQWFDCVDITIARDALAALEEWAKDTTSQSTRGVLVQLVRALSNGTYVEDPWMSVFGVPRDTLLDASGSVQGSRLLAHYYQRPRDLAKDALTIRVLTGCTSRFSVEMGAAIVALLETPNVLVTLRSTEVTFRHLLEMSKEWISARIGAVEGRADRARQSAVSFQAVLDAANAATDPRMKASWLLDSYRKIIEGQVRSRLWIILPGMLAEDSPPMMGQLENRVRHDKRPEVLSTLLFLKSAWRNSAAHEDWTFDDDDRLLDREGIPIGLAAIMSTIDDAIAFCAGWEVALSNFAAEGSLESSAAPPPSAFQVTRARNWFGDAGLLVSSVTLKQSELRISVDDLGLNQLDPAFQAMLLSKKSDVHFSRVEIIRTFDSEVVASGTLAAIELCEPLWADVRRYVFKNPGSTFLPLNYENRLRSESRSAARDAILWLLLNDAIEAYDRMWDLREGAGSAETLQVLRRRFALASPQILTLAYGLCRLRTTTLALESLAAMDPNAFERGGATIREALKRHIASLANQLRDDGVEMVEPSDLLSIRAKLPLPSPAPTLGIHDWLGIT